MGTEIKTSFSDDEEDLEALRLAALSSLKKKNEIDETPLGIPPTIPFMNDKFHNYNKNPFRGGKRRFFSGQCGRNGRMGQFNNQVRNSNLIAIPTVAEEKETLSVGQKSSTFVKPDNEPPRLILPQDRYASTTKNETETEGPSSKFDRYDNSNSESEDDDEISSSKLERSDSLEALMEELNAEIQGETKKDKKIKLKKDQPVEEKVETTTEETKVNEKNLESSSDESAVPNVETSNTLENSEVKTSSEENKPEVHNHQKTQPSNNQRSPSHRKMPNRRINGRLFKPDLPFIPSSTNPALTQNIPFINPLQPSQFTTVYNTVPSFTGPDLFAINVPPPPFAPPVGHTSHIPPLDITSGYGVPLQPLIIEPSTSISSIPLGPLSPRSAAFVLENRAIVEKRKRSPRRSYSRSPSPPIHRVRYSKSPPLRRSPSPYRRSLTPLKRSLTPSRRSVSPKHSPTRRSLSPLRKHRDKSPRRESPKRSPKRQRDSPKRSPKRSKESPKRRESRRTPVKDRLGTRTKNEEKNSKKKESSTTQSPTKKEEKSVDPVLEARKKKFESKEIQVKEGVIRLKPKEEANRKLKIEEIPSKEKKVLNDTRQKEEEIQKSKKCTKSTEKEETSTRIVLLPKNETKAISGESPPSNQLEEAMNELEMLLKDEEALELTAKVDDLFTDEETDQENEGRFKVKMAMTEENSTLKKQNQINGTTKSTSDKKPKWNFEEKKCAKPKKQKKEPLTNPIENRKIEIKIRNPSKYEKSGSQSFISSERDVSKPKELYAECEPEIILDNEDTEEEITEQSTENKEGDLRAQLSRKRAERQNKLPNVEGVQTRLLQNALEGAVFKKKKSKKKEKELKELRVVKKLIRKHDFLSGPYDFAVQSKRRIKFYRRFEIHQHFFPDVKLPIHLRLGIAHDSDIFAEAASEKISRKKSKKRKHASLEQV